ncbi:MAG: hypothetical protein H0W83_16395, partial [Planctomycetes bacterium]|nr:hypothetical protein [Planctomycetota bacterium]
MPRLLLIILSMLLANVSIDAASSSADSASRGQWTMHWRVFCDPEAGVSFRYPYDFYPKEQYSGDLADQRKQLRIP